MQKQFQGDQYSLPTRQSRIDDWARLFKSVTDPDEIAKTKREFERKERAEMKRKDTGL